MGFCVRLGTLNKPMTINFHEIKNMFNNICIKQFVLVFLRFYIFFLKNVKIQVL